MDFSRLIQEKELNKLLNKIADDKADDKVKREIKWNKIEARDKTFP